MRVNFQVFLECVHQAFLTTKGSREAVRKIKVGGYLIQNLISFAKEIWTYINGGWVTNADVTIQYIHNFLLNLAFTNEIV